MRARRTCDVTTLSGVCDVVSEEIAGDSEEAAALAPHTVDCFYLYTLYDEREK